jgi:hypothetical protein
LALNGQWNELDLQQIPVTMELCEKGDCGIYPVGIVEWRQDDHGTTSGAANGGPSDCRYVGPVLAGVEVTLKAGPAVEAGDVTVGENMFTKTLGEKGVGSSIEFGFKGLLSVQGKRDNAWASDPLHWSITILGFNKDLSTPVFSRSGWKFQPSKELRVGIQAGAGVEFGWSYDKFKQQVDRNIACGYRNGPP